MVVEAVTRRGFVRLNGLTPTPARFMIVAHTWPGLLAGGDMFRFAKIAVAVCGLLMLESTLMAGQSGAPSAGTGKGAIVGTGVFTVFVENMDRSLAFYHDVFEMEVPPLPASGARPYNNPNPRLFQFFDIPGAKERHQSARVPGIRTGVEAMEIQNVQFKTIPLRIQDPGAATLVLVVRDLDAALARVKQANVAIATPGGKPVTFADGTREILIRDVDSRYIEIRQPAVAPTSQSTSNIVDIRVSIAVNDMDRTRQIYRDVLGFKVDGETTFAADKAMQALTGLSSAEVRRSRVQAPGSSLWLEFVEFKKVDRTPLRMKIQDRGAARLQLRTESIDAMVEAVKHAGLSVATEGAVAVPIPPNMKGALVADPNNFFVTLFEACDGCAPRDIPATR
jgi:catechol 2,3-dioxygenase-like lactoylglutathione lyase family enzyme